jgi:hypothetical protein
MNQLQAWTIDNTLLIPYNKELRDVAESGAFYKTKYGTQKITIFIHHWGPEMDEDAEYFEDLWEKADVVICCHPEALPEWVRAKHPWPDHIGPVKGQLSDTHYEVYPAS